MCSNSSNTKTNKCTKTTTIKMNSEGLVEGLLERASIFSELNIAIPNRKGWKTNTEHVLQFQITWIRT